MASLDDLNATGKNIVANLGQLNQTMAALVPTFTIAGGGIFSLAVAPATAVSNDAVKSTSVVILTPVTAAAGTLQGSAKCLYIQALVPGSSFTVGTANGTNAVGTEAFRYAIFNPT